MTVGFVLVAPIVPWLLFEKLVDPPADRLMKWHIAGLEARDESITFATALRQAYANLSFEQWLDAKLHGFWLVFSGVLQVSVRFCQDAGRNLEPCPIDRFDSEPELFRKRLYPLVFHSGVRCGHCHLGDSPEAPGPGG